MKKMYLFGLMALFALPIVSCSKEKEMTKFIPADKVKFTGSHSSLFELDADSVKVMLIPVGTDGKKWEIRAIIPLRNTTPWSEIPGSDQSQSSFIYGVSMYVNYLDSYDSELDLSIENDYDIAKKLLKSEELITEDMPITEYSFGNKSYKYQKAYFDKIAGLKMKIELSWAHSANSSSSSVSSSSSSSSSSSKSSGGKKVKELLDSYEKFIDDYIELRKKAKSGDMSAINKYSDAYDDAEKIEDALDELEDDMTDAEFNRYLKLIDKLSKAATSF